MRIFLWTNGKSPAQTSMPPRLRVRLLVRLRPALPNLASRVFEHDVGKHCRIGLVWKMRTEADANVKRRLDVQIDRCAELVHRLALKADKQREGVAVLFDADPLSKDPDQAIRAS